jgi:malate dehydrogenase
MRAGRAKVAVMGAGATGAATAHWIAAKEIADIALIDVAEGLAKGKALDLYEAMPIEDLDVRVEGGGDYRLAEGADVVVITAGVGRKPGQSRDDLLRVNYEIVASVARQAVERAPDAVYIVLTNPVDVLTYAVQKATGLPYGRVFGQAGVLDSTRFRTFVAEAAGVSVEDVFAFVMGGHGDDMVPLVRYSTIGGLPLEKFLDRDTIDRIVARTRGGGGEIVSLLQTGSAFYAPGAAIAAMVEAVLRDKRRVIPVVAHLDGEYGERDIYVGVPALVGRNGVERVLEVDFTPEEAAAFRRSVASVRGPLESLGIAGGSGR